MLKDEYLRKYWPKGLPMGYEYDESVGKLKCKRCKEAVHTAECRAWQGRLNFLHDLTKNSEPL